MPNPDYGSKKPTTVQRKTAVHRRAFPTGFYQPRNNYWICKTPNPIFRQIVIFEIFIAVFKPHLFVKNAGRRMSIKLTRPCAPVAQAWISAILFKFPVMHLKGKSTPVGGHSVWCTSGPRWRLCQLATEGLCHIQFHPDSRKSMPVIICCCRDEKCGGSRRG